MQRPAHLAALAGAAFALAASAPPPPPPGGQIDVLDQGYYLCELPGDAATSPSRAAADFDFRVLNASSYRAGGQRGIYLLTGDTVTMTTGTLKGVRFHRISDTFLRRIEANGQDGDLRCVLSVHGRARPMQGAAPDAL